MSTIGERITSTALDILKNNPEGVRYAELVRKVAAADSSFKTNTIYGNVLKLHEQFPDKVYKPSRGLFRLLEFRDPETDQLKEELVPKQPRKIKEEVTLQPSEVGLG